MKIENLIEKILSEDHVDDFVDYAVDKKLIKDDSEKKRILAQIIRRDDLLDFLDFISVNTEKCRDILSKQKITDKKKSVEYIIKLLKTPAGLKRLTSFRGY